MPANSPEPAAAAWHAREAGDVASALGTDPLVGLTEAQARRRPSSEPLVEPPAWRTALIIFLRQWKGSVVLILCAAAAAFWALGHRNDAIGIILPVFLAVGLGFLTDYRSQQALAALRSLNGPTASVIRDGIMVEIPAGRLVPGDLVVLRAGAHVPADGRLTQAAELTIQEAALTGESEPASKTTATTAPGAPLAERSGMVFAGTTVSTGFGRMIVTAAGLDTELGRIGKLVQRQVKEDTPLEVQVEALGRRLGALIVAVSAGTTLLGLALGQPFWEMLETGFLLAIAAIPEGLPAVNTIALAGGIRRMVRERSVVRRLAAVEVLGSVDVVCTDKTGTLTENVMRAAVVCLPSRRLEVTGSGYSPEGGFREGTAPVDPGANAELQRLLRIAALCNNAVLESHEGWHVHGSPTEGALLTLAAQGGAEPGALRTRHPRLRELPFTPARKLMTVVVRNPAHGALAAVKGAVAVLLPRCVLGEQARTDILAQAAFLGAQGLRVLGFADRVLDDPETNDPESRLAWAGMVGLLDPPRRSAAEAVRRLSAAGVRTVMLTGDQRDTALAIARRLGLPADEQIFARVSPEDKLRIVESLKAEGHVVAMTGDGINDAPALRAADIGVAMGTAAADVAKEAADLVITDAEYATLATAVEEGRRIYANLGRSARYLLLCSLSNLGLMTAGIVLRLPLAMTALQLLWLNMVFHIFPGVALAVAPNPRRFMEEPARARDAELLGWGEILSLTRRSVVIWAATLAVYVYALPRGLCAARSQTIAALGLGLLLQVFPAISAGQGLLTGVRSAGLAVWSALAAGLGILGAMLYLPLLRELLGTTALGPRECAAPGLAALFCAASAAVLDRGRPGRAPKACGPA